MYSNEYDDVDARIDQDFANLCWCGVLIADHPRDISELRGRASKCVLTQEEVRAMKRV